MIKLVLVDRDGVINEELEGYVETPSMLRIYPQALEAFALLQQEGFTPVVVTNQSVVGRGRITLETLGAIHDYLCQEVQQHGGSIAEVMACTDHPSQATDRRKPGAGMLKEALAKYGAIAARTPMIGDAVTDMQAALAAGCPRYLVMTGKGKATSATLPEELHPVTLCDDILDAARRIVSDFS